MIVEWRVSHLDPAHKGVVIAKNKSTILAINLGTYGVFLGVFVGAEIGVIDWEEYVTTSADVHASDFLDFATRAPH
ncbi:MAG TPA: hypothetical protein PKY84_05395 [Thermosynergistes sp.]|nr:hypothetical protein [Thermosynergistes sp.]